jgi:hypothetical protein
LNPQGASEFTQRFSAFSTALAWAANRMRERSEVIELATALMDQGTTVPPQKFPAAQLRLKGIWLARIPSFQLIGITGQFAPHGLTQFVMSVRFHRLSVQKWTQRSHWQT